MSSKRKADLQRKLSLRSVPTPPDDLLDRIKSDIPKYLNVEAERARFSRSIGFHLKIAASVLLAITSLLGVLYVYSPGGDNAKSLAYPVTARAARPALDTVQIEIAEEPKPVMQVADVSTTTVAAAPQARVASTANTGGEAPAYYPYQSNEEIQITAEAPPLEARRRDEAAVGSAAPAPEPIAIAEAMPATTPDVAVPLPPPPVAASTAPAMGAPVMAAPPPPAPVMATTPQRQAIDLVTPAYAKKLELAPKSVFGLSIDPDAFRRIKTTIEHGGRPAPSNVDVEALVNYFAGGPERRLRRGNVRMEVEASPAPVEAPGNRGILRITIDTAELHVAEGGSTPPIARDAKLDIEFNSEAVRSLEPIGDQVSANPESALLHNLSVTGLYALDLKSGLRARDVVATIRLRYRSVSDGKAHTVSRVVYGSEFAKQWSGSTRRHRLASLGALWGESLRSTQSGTDVAKRAEELATQEPNDERAQELAAVAKESSGGSR